MPTSHNSVLENGSSNVLEIHDLPRLYEITEHTYNTNNIRNYFAKLVMSSLKV